MRKGLLDIIKIGFTILVFYIIFSKMDIRNLLKLLSNASIFYLGCAVGFMFLIPLILGTRLSIVTGIPFKIFPTLMIKVYFFNNLLPAQVGGDMFKFVVLKRYKDGAEVFSAIFSDRLLGITGLLLYSSFNIIVFPSYITDNRIYYGVIFYISILLGILATIFFMPEFDLAKIKNKLVNRGLNFLYKIKKNAKGYYTHRFGVSILISIIAYFILVLVNMLAMKALNMRIDFWASSVYVPLISVAVITFPISFNGLGVRESLFILFFSMAEYTLEESIAMALVNLFSIWIVSILGGVLVLLSNEKINTLSSKSSLTNIICG